MEASRREVIGGAAGALAASAVPATVVGETPRSQRLWYRQPASVWTEALPVGNGRLGAMVFGGAAHERLQLNEDTLWSGGPHDPVNPEARAAIPEVRRMIAAGRYAEAQALANAKVMAKPLSQMSYQPIGNLLLDLPGLGAVDAYERELDLDAAMATTTFRAGGVRYVRRVLASAIDGVIAVELVADRAGAIDLDVRIASPQRGRVEAEGDRLRFTGHAPDENGVSGATPFALAAQVLPRGGQLAVAGERLTVRGANSVVVLVAAATGYRRFDDVGGDPLAVAEAQLVRSAAKPFARIATDATADHRRLFRRVKLDLGRTPAADLPTDARVRADDLARDPALAALYFDYARYLLIACSRPGGQPANLQGLWSDSVKPPWGSKYTININTEMNYWPAEVCGLGECVEPLARTVRELAVTGARTAREMYGARGWVAHHNTDGWRATAPIDGAQWGLWPMGGAWLCLHLWDRYDYDRDVAYLRSIYPLLKGAALFFLDTLQRDAKTGSLVTSPSVSPENVHPHGASVCAGPAMDGQILRDLFDRTVQAAAILGVDADFAADVKATHARLAPDRIGAQGQLQEWQEDWDAAAPEPHHRHVSHLYALFPSDQIDLARTPALAAAARRSLELRGDESTGWATAWRANLWARLGEGDHAHRILAYLLGPDRTYPNLFDAHPPFQIDGNFGGARAITELLMRSTGDTLHMLPALSRAWPSGSVTGLRAHGGLTVDLAWRGGQLATARIAATLPIEVTVRLGQRLVAVALARGQVVRFAGPNLRRV